MPPFNKYQYEPLCEDDAIRLIVLNSAKDIETPPTCSIIQRRRSELPTIGVEYNAISYAWGKPQFSRNLEIKCRHDVSYLRITSNVDEILRHLRARDGKSRYVWMDAICLNQDDETEKAHQIRNMGFIYSEAKQVDIWLGLTATAVTSQVLNFFREASEIPEASHPEVSEIIVQLMKKIPSEDRSGVFRAPGVCDVFSFFDAPWFARRWVIQEACLARKAIVHCGGSFVPLAVLRQAVVKFLHLDLSSYKMIMTTHLHKATAKFNILEGLWKFHEALCREKRDRIVSLLGLVSDRDGLQIDYFAPWTEIYHSVASYCLSSERNDVGLQILLHLFEFGSIAARGKSSPPSWVPDWSRSRIRKLPYHSCRRNVDTLEQYPSSPGYPAVAAMKFQHGCLQVYSNPLTGGSRGGRVRLATTLGSGTNGKAANGQKGLDALCKLCPSPDNARPRMEAFFALIKSVTTFLHGRDGQKLGPCPTTKVLLACLADVQRGIPDSCSDLTAMKNIETLLEEFCLFEVEPLDPPENKNHRAFGLSSQQIQAGDVVISLWRPEPGGHMVDVGDYAGDFYTMLVVRYTGKECSEQHHGGWLSGRISNPVPHAVVIGPGICVPTLGNGQGVPPTHRDAGAGWGGRFCVCLV